MPDVAGPAGGADRSDTWSELVVRAYRGRDGAALIGERFTWTGRELLARAVGAAGWLTALVPAGVPVPALLSAGPEAVALVLGGSFCDRPLAPLSPRATVAELRDVLDALPGTVLLAVPESKPLADRVAGATGRQAVLVHDIGPAPGEPPVPPADGVAYYLHTSGTTGRPKPVALWQGALAVRCRVTGELTGMDAHSVYATGSPFQHIAGLGNMSVALAAGAAIVPVPRFTVPVWRSVQRWAPTHCLLVPSMIEMLLAEGALRSGSLRTLMYGASPIRPATLRRVLAALPDTGLVNLFGQTEGSPISCLRAADHRRADAGREDLLASVGRAAPGVELRIDDPDADGVGEVWARGAHLFVTDERGWLHSGDLGRLDDEGYLYLSGRLGDRIVRGGENVHPVEVEDVLAAHPSVADAAVVGVPDDRLGETVAAFVVPADQDRPPDWAELRAHARERLSGFKVPVEWTLVDALPRNATGKVLRRQLRR